MVGLRVEASLNPNAWRVGPQNWGLELLVALVIRRLQGLIGMGVGEGAK